MSLDVLLSAPPCLWNQGKNGCDSDLVQVPEPDYSSDSETDSSYPHTVDTGVQVDAESIRKRSSSADTVPTTCACSRRNRHASAHANHKQHHHNNNNHHHHNNINLNKPSRRRVPKRPCVTEVFPTPQSSSGNWRDHLIGSDVFIATPTGRKQQPSLRYCGNDDDVALQQRRSRERTRRSVRRTSSPRALSLERATLRRKPKEWRDFSPTRVRRSTPKSHTPKGEGGVHQNGGGLVCSGPTSYSMKQIRSHSVENGANGAIYDPRRQRSSSGASVSNGVGLPAKGGSNTDRGNRRLDDDAAIKRSRAHANSQYEMSQDLLDKQVEMLERKYGGVRARHAATTIQRAFRSYSIQKRFFNITQEASRVEKRRGRLASSGSSTPMPRDGGDGSLPTLMHHRLHQQPLMGNGSAPEGMTYGHTMYRVPAPGNHHQHFHHHHLHYARATPVWNGIPTPTQHPPPQITHHGSEILIDACELHSEMIPMMSVPIDPAFRLYPRHPDKVPPQVPKRTTSIQPSGQRDSLGSDSAGSLLESSTTSSESSQTAQLSNGGTDISPLWLRKNGNAIQTPNNHLVHNNNLDPAKTGLVEDKRLSNISENSEDSMETPGYASSNHDSALLLYANQHNMGSGNLRSAENYHIAGFKVSEIQRKRQYRVGLNLFNKKPERGVGYLIERGFLDSTPEAVARFLISRKGLSKQMIGEYLGNLQQPFNMAVLESFVRELDLAGMQVDVALRKFQSHFILPGEAQKIEHLVEVFSRHFVQCNRDIVCRLHNPDTVFVLAFSIVLLNTDLHTPSIKDEKRMKLDDYIKNLRGVDDGHDLDRDMLCGIYERIKKEPFKPGSDHVTQVLKVQQTIVGKKPNLAIPHRRLVCYCRLYEVFDINKKERPGIHQREVFLFNDMLMVTKIFSKKKNSTTYTFRQSIPLCGLTVTLFEAPHYPHGISLSQRVDDKTIMTFNARNSHDRSKFVDDLKESILEMDEMEALRIEAELEKHKQGSTARWEQRDSGVADIEIITGGDGATVLHSGNPCSGGSQQRGDAPGASSSTSPNALKRSPLSNSLLDLNDPQLPKPMRRGSAGSLDSGMSVSFQSSAASTVSSDSSPQTVPSHNGVIGAVGGSGSSLQRNESSSSGEHPRHPRAAKPTRLPPQPELTSDV